MKSFFSFSILLLVAVLICVKVPLTVLCKTLFDTTYLTYFLPFIASICACLVYTLISFSKEKEIRAIELIYIFFIRFMSCIIISLILSYFLYLCKINLNTLFYFGIIFTPTFLISLIDNAIIEFMPLTLGMVDKGLFSGKGKGISNAEQDNYDSDSSSGSSDTNSSNNNQTNNKPANNNQVNNNPELSSVEDKIKEIKGDLSKLKNDGQLLNLYLSTHISTGSNKVFDLLIDGDLSEDKKDRLFELREDLYDCSEAAKASGVIPRDTGDLAEVDRISKQNGEDMRDICQEMANALLSDNSLTEEDKELVRHIMGEIVGSVEEINANFDRIAERQKDLDSKISEKKDILSKLSDNAGESSQSSGPSGPSNNRPSQ